MSALGVPLNLSLLTQERRHSLMPVPHKQPLPFLSEPQGHRAQAPRVWGLRGCEGGQSGAGPRGHQLGRSSAQETRAGGPRQREEFKANLQSTRHASLMRDKGGHRLWEDSSPHPTPQRCDAGHRGSWDRDSQGPNHLSFKTLICDPKL